MDNYARSCITPAHIGKGTFGSPDKNLDSMIRKLLTSSIKITILYTYNCIRMVLWLTGEMWCVIVLVDFDVASPVANKFNVIRDVEVGCNENDNTCFLKFENLVYCIESLDMTILCERMNKGWL